ncbi:TSUP family transporter [Stutzerimonas zhaodongensis]|uniref:TSUP family transporter n=1 Tax=Stutzerimonas zhaodongensis TaxID=1176257 RepID=UPI0039F111AC
MGVGILVGLTGGGGGALMTPLLVLLFGYAPGVAVATDLLFAAVTKTCGVAFTIAPGRSTPWCCAVCCWAACRRLCWWAWL